MSLFAVKKEENGSKYLETALSGMDLLNSSVLNKGGAFTYRERLEFDLLGALPYRVESLEDQVVRHYQQYQLIKTDLERNIYLHALHDRNETLFYKLVGEYLAEMLPIVYTPTVSEAVQQFSRHFRKQRGLYVSYEGRKRIGEILDHRINEKTDLIVVTDGSAVLGIGDQGIGGMAISIAKLIVYTLLAGISPQRVLAIQLDVGTNNKELLANSTYLGWQHERVSDDMYESFVDDFVAAVRDKLPDVYLHWEDIDRRHSRKILNRYRQEICTFNDDIQGTGAVTLASLMAAVKTLDTTLLEQRIVLFGAGSAAMGIAEQVLSAMIQGGLSREEAYKRFWVINSNGLLTEETEALTEFQKPFARSKSDVQNWSSPLNLLEVVKQVHPTILIGCSTAHGAFNEEVVKIMAKHVKRPIIFPLSNPLSKTEATPSDLFKWTEGKVLCATGSPFEPVSFRGKQTRIAQCNNALIYPGLGLGVIISKARRLSDRMICVACDTLSEYTQSIQGTVPVLLPDLSAFPQLSQKIALAVAKQAREERLASVPDEINFKQAMEENFWQPEYYPYKRIRRPDSFTRCSSF